ncbi:hypothetical protein WMY93_028108 [Mugilogobius chulae]|uniref:Uncharacterized protein n=1 Tax=Mugilogobius chulae TaxID=88201 RepID=A0AAW0MYC6_9GOBI
MNIRASSSKRLRTPALHCLDRRQRNSERPAPDLWAKERDLWSTWVNSCRALSRPTPAPLTLDLQPPASLQELCSRARAVLKTWIRPGSDLVQTWFRPGSDSVLVQTWFRPGSVLAQTRFRPGSDLVQTQTWFSPGSDLVQTWFRPGSVLVQTRLRPGSDLVQTWFRPGSDLVQTCFSPQMLWLPLVVALLSVSGACREQDYKQDSWDYKDGGGRCCGWRCMLLTLQWPGSFCQILYDETLCKIPPNVNDWTIHGLWPFKAHNCCHCWPMFHSDINDLETNLTDFWPSLLKTRSNFEFWRSEWDKHGVCAACVEGLNSPLRYFQTCLQLRQRFHMFRVLDKAGISPSCNQTYEVRETLTWIYRSMSYVRSLYGLRYWLTLEAPEDQTMYRSNHGTWFPHWPYIRPCPLSLALLEL